MKQLAISFIILSLCACTHSDRNMSYHNLPLSSITVKWNRQTELLDTTDYEVTEVLPLKIGESLFIGNIDKLKRDDGYTFILDKESAGKVYIFDALGNMVASIGTIGHANNEYLRGPSDFSIDRQQKELCVFEAESSKILRYDFNGNLTSVIHIKDYWPYSFSVLSKNRFAFAFRMLNDEGTNDNCELIVSDTMLNVKKQWRPLIKDQLFTKDFPFWSNGEENFYIPNMSDTILVLNKDSVTHRIHVDFAGSFISPLEAAKVKFEGDYEILMKQEGIVNSICKFEENKYWINMEYSSGIIHHYLKDKITGKEYQGVAIFDGIFPIRGLRIEGENIIGIILKDDIENLRLLLKDNNSDFNPLYKRTHKVIKEMIEGHISTPALVSIHIRKDSL